MSTPESICVSLEMAKRLKEAGWQQNPYIFEWQIYNFGSKDHIDLVCYHSEEFKMKGAKSSAYKKIEFYSAPTAEEILRKLPEIIEESRLNCIVVLKGWCVSYADPLKAFSFEDESLANAAAACYCYLAEHDLLAK